MFACGCQIFFPTNFQTLSRVYEAVMAKSPAEQQKHKREVRVLSNAKFCEEFAEVEETATRNGYNPMLEDFSNASVMLVT